MPCTVWESDLSELATSGGFLDPWIFFGNGAFENHSTRLHIAARFFWLTYIESPHSTCNLTVAVFPCHDSPSFFEGVECNTICSLDGAFADPELRGNLVAGVVCNAAQDEHKATKYVEAGMNLFGVFDQQLKAVN